MLANILGTEDLKVVPALFAYLFYRINQKQFLQYIEDKGLVADRAAAVALKERARGNGYIFKNCKLYAWACWTARSLGRKLPPARDFNVAEEDAKILRRLNLKHLGKDKWPAYSLQSFDALLAAKVGERELKNYIGKFVTKKMTFLMKSFGETRHDLETNLQVAAINAIYKQYPRFYSDLHIVNVAKAAIHNTGHTMITSLSSKSRQRLVKNADGSFEATHVDIAVLADVSAPPQYGALMSDHLQALEKVQHKLSDRVKQYLHCAAGQYHEGLSQFLGASNEELSDEWPYHRYLSKVRQFFDISETQEDQLYASIRRFSTGTA